MLSKKLLAATMYCMAFAQAVHAADNTHIDNHSKTWTILATTSYPGGNSKFVNRKIPPGGSDVDTYNPVGHVDIRVQVDGASLSGQFTIKSDASVVVEDTPGDQYGVAFWLNDGKGNPVETSSPLVIVFAPRPSPSPSASPSPPATPASPSPSIVPRGALYWNDVTDEGCKSPGYRQMSAHLVGSSSRSAWNADCKATPFSPNKFETLSGDDTSCADNGLFRGERGTWQVYDKACLPYWGNFRDDGCKSKGFRQYSSVLYNIPYGQSWENWCSHFPADIQGVGVNTQHFFKPDRCVNVLINMWGEFDYPDNACCGNSGNPGGNHDELVKAGSRKLLVYPARCDAVGGANVPITTAAFLLALLRNVRYRDQAEIQFGNTAIQALQPPGNSAGRNPRTRTRFWERDVFTPGSNNGQFRENFRVPVFQAFPDNHGPENPPAYLPAQSDAFDATWVPRFMVGEGPLTNPSFVESNENGVIDIPASAYVTIDANGPDVLLTAQLTGCAFVWAYDPVNRVFYAAHINPSSDPHFVNLWARNGHDLAVNLASRGRFHGQELSINVYGRNGFGYIGNNQGNIMAVRSGNGWEVVAQTLSVDRSVPTDVRSLNYDNVQP